MLAKSKKKMNVVIKIYIDALDLWYLYYTYAANTYVICFF